MISQHMRYTAAAMIPTGDFLAHVGDWTGLPPRRAARPACAARRRCPRAGPTSSSGSPPPSATTPRPRELLQSDDDPANVLDALRALPGEAGSAISGYLDLVGCRPLDGFDICEPSALELPDALLRSIRVAASGRDLEHLDGRRPHRGHPRSGPRGAPRRVRRAARARRGSSTGSATSAASTATSGRRG